MCTRAVCGLAHYLEREGIPTTLIGAIRDHVALLRPPRALVVPFELGRPFGAPDAPEFQRRVLRDVLALLERTDGPILVDFPDGPPAPQAGLECWTPPPDLACPERAPRDPVELTAAVRSEIARLRPLRDRWVRDHGSRRFDRLTGLDLDRIVALIVAYTRDQSIANPLPQYGLDRTVKFATDDLKHFYYQAALSRPGRITDIELDDWFFGSTLSGEMLLRLRAALLASDDPNLQRFGETSFVPSHQAHRQPSQ
ncbi:MAG TPA: hypothetical protein VMU87_14405 [Stellaceae bacterium]|nr:hypothetical protein [Stellaceae bacterium]